MILPIKTLNPIISVLKRRSCEDSPKRHLAEDEVMYSWKQRLDVSAG